MPITDDQLAARSKASQELVSALVQALQGQAQSGPAARTERIPVDDRRTLPPQARAA